MTLNITVVTGESAYQSADFQLWDVNKNIARAYPSQKSVIAQGSGWTALIAFAGIGSVDRLDVGNWLARVVNGITRDASFEDLLQSLKRAESWLRAIPSSFDSRHTFSIAGFIGVQPVMAMVSNFQSLWGPE